jgi:hypothetical protein
LIEDQTRHKPLASLHVGGVLSEPGITGRSEVAALTL